MNVSDPLFIEERVDRGAVYDLPALNGVWSVETITQDYPEYGTRIAELRCRHSSVSEVAPIDEQISNDIGVDVATVCVYDSPDTFDEAWSSGQDVVIGPHGACSTSGIGDGQYSAYGRYHAGELVAVRVVYIPDAEGRMPWEHGFPHRWASATEALSASGEASATMLARSSHGKGTDMKDDGSNERTETDERVAENRTPAQRAPVSRDDGADTDPGTGMPPGMHDDDASPLDRGKPLDPFGGKAPG